MYRFQNDQQQESCIRLHHGSPRCESATVNGQVLAPRGWAALEIGVSWRLPNTITVMEGKHPLRENGNHLQKCLGRG